MLYFLPSVWLLVFCWLAMNSCVRYVSRPFRGASGFGVLQRVQSSQRLPRSIPSLHNIHLRTTKLGISTGGDDLELNAEVPRIEPNLEDMKTFAIVLANVTDALDAAPENALTIISKEMGWLYARDIPKLTQMLLQEVPEVRKDRGMMKAYYFIIDFLDVVSKETSTRIKENQQLMRQVLEAAKVSEAALDTYIAENSDKLLGTDFSVYLQTEIEHQDSDSPMEQLLVTIQLRLLDEQGKKLGVDVQLLPKLAAETDPAEMKRMAEMHLSSYDATGRALFLQTLRIMLSEMRKRYSNVDPLLLNNLQEVEKVTEMYLKKDSSAN